MQLSATSLRSKSILLMMLASQWTNECHHIIIAIHRHGADVGINGSNTFSYYTAAVHHVSHFYSRKHDHVPLCVGMFLRESVEKIISAKSLHCDLKVPKTYLAFFISCNKV